MIETTPNTALMLYLGFTLVVLLGIWGWSHYTGRKRKILPLERKLHICEFCHFAYLDQDIKTITRCPRCHSFND